MQLFFLPFASLFFWVFLEVVVKLFDYFWKPNISLSKSCVNCLLRIYFVYWKIYVSNDVNGACWCTCSLVALRVLKYGSDRNEGNWLQLLFYFFVLVCIVASVIGTTFFFRCFSDFRLNFSRVAIRRKRLQLDSKSDLISTGLISEFFVGLCFVSSTSYLRGLKSARLAHFSFYTDIIKFFR